jgi:colicin import membrane protein
MEAEEARSNTRAAQQRIGALERELKSAKDDLGKLAIEAEASAVSEAALQVELARLSEAQSASGDIARERARAEEQERLRAGAEQELARERVRAEDQERLRAGAEQELARERARAEELERLRTESAQELARERARAEELQKKSGDDVTGLNAELVRLKDELEAAGGREAAMSDEIEAAHRDSGSRTLLTSALERERSLRSELAAAVERAEAARKDLLAAKAELCLEAENLGDMQRKLDEATGRLKVQRAGETTAKHAALDKDLRAARSERDAVAERAAKAEARAADLQAMLDGIGRERAQLRSEAGALRARVESLTSAANRARSLIELTDDLRSDAAFATVERKSERISTPPPVSGERKATGRIPTPPPVPPKDDAADGPIPLPPPTRKR